MMLLKCCTKYASKFGKLSSGHGTGKGQFLFQSQRRTMPKNVQTTAQLHSSHMLAKQCSKSSKPGFTNTCAMNFQMFKLDLEMAEEPEIKLPTPVDHRKSKRIPEKHLLHWLLKPLTVWITTNCAKFLKRWEYQTTLPSSWEICMQVKKQQLEPNVKEWTGSTEGKEYIKAVYCHPAYLTSMQSISCKMLAGWSTSWNQDCWEKYQ